MKKRTLSIAGGVLLASAVAFGAGDAGKGRDIFDQNCFVCHNADSADAKIGPGLKGLFKKAELANKKKVSDASVLDFINKGSSEKGMPAFADILSDTEKADLIAYLKTL
ncbi:MAG TPA: cytochrome c [Bryobacteraceae bacterium]|nr:cytochrome c [Bryobacteraceae bacterium]